MIIKILTKLFGPAMDYPAYRAFWFGTMASVSGFQILSFSQFWLIHELTQSPMYLGYVGLASAIPSIVLNVFGGVLADKISRQKLIAVTQTVNAILILFLALLTATGIVEAWHVIILAFFTGAINAFDQPARQAIYPSLIDHKVMMNAVALNSVIWTGTSIIAPAVAGLIISLAGTAIAFGVAAVGFITMAIIVFSLHVPLSESSLRTSNNDLIAGIRFVLKNNIFIFLIGMSFFISFFGMSYIPLMPVFTVEVLKVSASAQGILMGFGGVGSLLSTLVLARIGNFDRKGLLIVVGAFIFGGLITTFALTSKEFESYSLAIVLIFLIGVSFSVFWIPIMSSLQIMVPDHMRGRVMGVFGITWSIVPLGAIYVGSVAGFIGSPSNGVPIAVAIGGMMIMLFAMGPALLNKNVRQLGLLLSQHIRDGESGTD